jgi:3D (Asp-Asp-Asp) domain-containing protein
MKYLFYIIACLIFLCPRLVRAEEQTVLARVTVYWGKSASGERACWNGARLHEGHCAVDPRKIPYGTQILFPDRACTAVDTGPDVVSRRAARGCGRTASERNALVIDRFFQTRSEALAWAGLHSQFMTVRIVRKESKSAAPKVVAAEPGCVFLDDLPAS